ncbi:hypothetical protein GALMADRAFT_1353873, partial [Galerina marginata CBS 339.88]
MLDGTSKPHIGSILEKIYRCACSVKFRENDNTVPAGSSSNMFSSHLPPGEIKNARPGMITWAVRVISKEVNKEAEEMIRTETGLHLRASSKYKATSTESAEPVEVPDHKKRVSWNDVGSFSFNRLEKIANGHAPIMSFLIDSYLVKEFANADPGSTVDRRIYRPEKQVALNALMSLTFGRSSHANYYQICRSIWLFAIKAPYTLFRVESRLGLSVAISSVYDALREMSRTKRQELKQAVEDGKHHISVSDNIQTYSKERDRRIGRENKMITGLAATAIEMEDYDPAAFDLDKLIERQVRQERKELNIFVLLKELDNGHLERVSISHFLRPLIRFVPKFSIYQKDLNQYAEEFLQKNPIPKTRHSKITPLATNSADEMHIQGLKEGILDFKSTQMGVNSQNLKNTASVWSGDGKTFNMFLLAKKLLAAEPDNFDSLRWLVPLLELWHTKWTDLSRVVRTHWGSRDDPSSLASIAQLAECPTPSDMRKVDFYDGSHLVNLALDAHILNCWELHFNKTNDLVEHINQLPELPTFEQLVRIATTLSRRHATTGAFLSAKNPSGNNSNLPPTGSPWTRREDLPGNLNDAEMEELADETIDDDLLPLPLPEPRNDADKTLANSALFMRNAIWWREVCSAIA